MTLARIRAVILDESSSSQTLRAALDDYALICSEASGIAPDASFGGWAEDAFLETGVAINPQAAAHCVRDYRRSVVFLRAVYAAIQIAGQRFPGVPIDILYAGCGPFATLLLPLLGAFKPGQLKIRLLDVHPRSLDSVRRLIYHFGFEDFSVDTVQADACNYQHPGKLHLIIAETMQKSLEQEPQFALTANLAPQLHPQGLFIPQKIEVELCLAHLDEEARQFEQGFAIDPVALVAAGERYPVATVLTLLPRRACEQLREARCSESSGKLELKPVNADIPHVQNLPGFDALLFTRIQVFERYWLRDYEAEITLPLRCHELYPLRPGASWRVCYQLGNYPTFSFS